MKLILPLLLNILLAVLINYLFQKEKFKKLSYIKQQIIIGIAFGIVSAFASSFGVNYLDVIINVRDAAPITAALVYGPISGVISGFIGGSYRALSVLWGAGKYTVVACTISTIVAGIAASIVRKYMFDNKRPRISYALGITVVIEVFHMLMIFLTNINDPTTAFMFVRQCTFYMFLANGLSVGLAVVAVSIMDKEFKIKRVKGDRKILDIFQASLLTTLLLVLIITSIFTFYLQTGMYNNQTEDMFATSIQDITTDIRGESDELLLDIVKDVKDKYLADESIDLNTLLISEEYEIKEINIVSAEGIITKSNDLNNYNFDMKSNSQSKEFMILANSSEEVEYVQSYMKNAKGNFRKYAGISLGDGGYIQVGYDSVQFQTIINSFVIKSIKNRHVGSSGEIRILDENLNIISNDKYNNMHVSSIGIIPNEEMNSKVMATEIYKADAYITKTKTIEESLYTFTFSEGYCIISLIPAAEVMLIRDASIHISIFIEILIFAILFIVITYIIKKKIVNNIELINTDLENITSGNLDTMVNVHVSEEFILLSNDINTTVSALKNYISIAETRINQELEYAKQIQLQVLPVDFPNTDKFSIYSQMIAAKEVGGDFYDFYMINDSNVAFLVADVSGKGIPAALFMMRAKTIIKSLAEAKHEVNEIFNIANEKLCNNNETGMFVTAWMGIFNIETGVLKFCNAGHNPPLILNPNLEFEYLKTRPGLVLGGMEGIKYRLNEIKLERGSRLFLYTDGVTEATNKFDELYQESRLKDYLNNNKNLKSEMLLSFLKQNIDDFADGAQQFDDITMLIFDYKCDKIVIEEEFIANDNELHKVLAMFENNLSECNCNAKDIIAICVAIEEIFINVCHYAYSDSIGICNIKLSIDKSSRLMNIEISDSGKKFNPLLRDDPDITLSAEERKIGGLGIFIVKKTMDEVSYKYENNKNILMLKKII